MNLISESNKQLSVKIKHHCEKTIFTFKLFKIKKDAL